MCFEKLCGLEISSMQVSRAMQELDEELANWRLVGGQAMHQRTIAGLLAAIVSRGAHRRRVAPVPLPPRGAALRVSSTGGLN